MYKIILAFFVCFSDCDVSDFPLHDLMPITKEIAIQKEWVCNNDGLSDLDTVNGINFLRLRRKTYEPMPPTAMLKILPPLEILGEWYEMNVKHTEWLSKRAEVDILQKDLLLAYANECLRLRSIIALAIQCQRDVSSSYANILMQRQYLNSLRDEMGVERFYLGRFPPFVPLDSVPEQK